MIRKNLTRFALVWRSEPSNLTAELKCTGPCSMPSTTNIGIQSLGAGKAIFEAGSRKRKQGIFLQKVSLRQELVGSYGKDRYLRGNATRENLQNVRSRRTDPH